MTHICVSDLTIIGSDNGLSPGRRQAIIRTNAGILLKRPLGTNFSEILIKILLFSFKKMHLKVSSAKRRPFCLGLNVLRSGAWVPLNSFWFFLCFFFPFFVCLNEVMYHWYKYCQEYVQVLCTRYFWALWSFQMFTCPLFQLKLHLLTTVRVSYSVDFKAPLPLMVKFTGLAGIVNATVY